jgi:hypothetical protein
LIALQQNRRAGLGTRVLKKTIDQPRSCSHSGIGKRAKGCEARTIKSTVLRALTDGHEKAHGYGSFFIVFKQINDFIYLFIHFTLVMLCSETHSVVRVSVYTYTPRTSYVLDAALRHK